MVDEIVDMATKEADHATRVFIDWKVTEQVEVATANQLWVYQTGRLTGQILMLEGASGR